MRARLSRRSRRSRPLGTSSLDAPRYYFRKPVLSLLTYFGSPTTLRIPVVHFGGPEDRQMAFKAATDGECVKCKQPIHKGDPITWKRTGPLAGRYHFTCPGDVPPAVSIVMEPAKPTVEPTAEPAEPACDDFTAEPECELAPIVEPGSRAWLRTASRSEREDYMLSVLRASEAPITRRDWAKLTARMMARLSDKQARKLSRWARGVWAGVTLHAWPADDDDYRQMALDFAEPVEQAHGELVMGWRSLVAAWNEGV